MESQIDCLNDKRLYDQIVLYECNFINVVTLLCTFGARIIRHAQIERLCTVAIFATFAEKLVTLIAYTAI